MKVDGLSFEIPDELVEAIAQRVAVIVDERAAQATTWIRGANNAAAYLGCKPKRIYELVESGRLEHRKDGTRLLFRPEWLDAYAEGGSANGRGAG